MPKAKRMSAESHSRLSLFDIQVNGFAGVDFQNPRLKPGDLHRACLALRHHFTHRILLTLVTDTIGALEGKFARIEAMRASDPLAAQTIVGYHLEGPYLSPEEGYRGAHVAEYMKRPDVSEFRRLQKAAGGNIRLLTLAPEWPGSARFISVVAASGVVVSLGHTNASSAQIDASIRAGARMCTHLGNGCLTLMPRHDNIIQRLLARDELTACFIPDGIHIPPPMLKNYIRAKPKNKIIITTDAVAGAGSPPGPFLMQRGKKMMRYVCDRKGMIALPGHPGYLFGSSLTLDKGVANISRWTEFSGDTAWDWASRRPAELLGIRLPRIEASLPRESGTVLRAARFNSNPKP
jgi:N-acetylglucosamine-6-phosphate deacetylase